MSVGVLILGESGAGKSTALRNLDPARTLLLQAIPKPLPFRAPGWALVDKQGAGNIVVSDSAERICRYMRGTKRDVVVIDDWQYILANEFMRRSAEHGFAKFTEIGRNAWDVLTAATGLAPHQRVYVLAHATTDEYGRTRCKTIGRMLDEKVVIEGLFSIVLRAQVRDGQHVFTTRNSGADTVKSPIGLFPDDSIPNDLAAVDAAIVAYYSL